MNTKNAFIQRIVAFVFVAVLTLSAFGVSLGQSAVGNNSASFAPVSVAYAAEDNGPGGIFDAIVSDPDKNGNITITKPDQSDDWKPAQLVSKSKAIAMIFTGICTVVALCFVIFNITKLGAAGANDAARSKAKTGLLWSLIAMALMGGLTIVVGFFWNILSSVPA